MYSQKFYQGFLEILSITLETNLKISKVTVIKTFWTALMFPKTRQEFAKRFNQAINSLHYWLKFLYDSYH